MNRAEATQKAVLMLVSGLRREDVLFACLEKLSLSAPLAEDVVEDAERRIVLAANYDRHKELGQAYTRLTGLYADSASAADYKTALGAQKELNKLLKLYDVERKENDEDCATTEDSEELAAIRAHLEPLKLAGDGYPLRELARMAADIVRQYRVMNGKTQ